MLCVEMGTIGEEIHQTRPFESATEEAVVTLVATAERVRDALSRVVGERGITLQQYNVLRILRGAGASGLPTLDIASRMIDKSPGITRLLDRLEARRLVRRVRCPEDRRQMLCYATAQAQQLLADLDSPMARGAGELLAPLGRARTLTLIGLLDEVRKAAASSTRQPSKPEIKKVQS
jgi:DNA-binding MarR family transcriptional regulator